MILTAVIVPSAMSAALIALLAIDAEVILDNGMALFILYSVYGFGYLSFTVLISAFHASRPL